MKEKLGVRIQFTQHMKATKTLSSVAENGALLLKACIQQQ